MNINNTKYRAYLFMKMVCSATEEEFYHYNNSLTKHKGTEDGVWKMIQKYQANELQECNSFKITWRCKKNVQSN